MKKIILIISILILSALLTISIINKDNTNMSEKEIGKTIKIILDEPETVFRERIKKELNIKDHPTGMTF